MSPNPFEVHDTEKGLQQTGLKADSPTINITEMVDANSGSENTAGCHGKHVVPCGIRRALMLGFIKWVVIYVASLAIIAWK